MDGGGQVLPAHFCGEVGQPEIRRVNQAFYRFYAKAKKFYAKDICISCGKCQHVCPLNNIRLENGKPVWGAQCTHCMACISKCPVEAIEYGKATRNKQRYLCPPYQGRESQ